jgi:hypothetical protein
MKTEFYLRYADDIVIMANKKEKLLESLGQIRTFLEKDLGLQLHPDKISFKTWRQGVDILGYISHPNYREIRTKTKHRIRHAVRAKKWLEREGLIEPQKLPETIASYQGRIKHAWSRRLAEFLDIC